MAIVTKKDVEALYLDDDAVLDVCSYINSLDGCKGMVVLSPLPNKKYLLTYAKQYEPIPPNHFAIGYNIGNTDKNKPHTAHVMQYAIPVEDIPQLHIDIPSTFFTGETALRGEIGSLNIEILQ